MSYDATNKRVREVEELEFGSERDFYDVLYLYNEVMKMVITKIIFLKTTTFYRALPEVMAGWLLWCAVFLERGNEDGDNKQTKRIYIKKTFHRAVPEVMPCYDFYDVLYLYSEVIKMMITKIINSFFSGAHFQRLWRLRYSTRSAISFFSVCLSVCLCLSLSLSLSPCIHFHSFNDASYICV